MATTSLEQVRQLLEATQVIVSHQAHIARLSGMNFNVFRLLRMERDEVRLHSRFIAGLLDPRGSHEQGSVFLEMFLRQVECSLPGHCRMDADKASVFPEYYIGGVDRKDGDSTGGRIDIYITDGARQISIENKIDHGEGDHQVDSYCNYKPESNSVLYLTPDGRCANTEKSNYKPISYGSHIVPWLERCHKYCTDLPVLRESIKQYLVVVRELTGGDPLMQEINEGYKSLLRTNMAAARQIYLHYKPTLYELIREFAKELQTTLQEEVNRRGDRGDWSIKSTPKKDDLNEEGLKVKSEAWPAIGYVKWQYNRGYFEYGFYDPGRSNPEIKSRLGAKVGKLSLRPESYWPFKERMRFPNLEEDMAALKRLLDEHERSTSADQVAHEVLEFVHACDAAFKAST